MPAEIPSSMLAHMSKWNDGKGVSLDTWIGGLGNFDLAIGYSTLFWPEFQIVDEYILRKNASLEALRGFETNEKATPKSIEWVMNHLHIADIHLNGDVNATAEHCLYLGETLKEIYEAKLSWQFPDRPCEVEFYVPEDKDDLIQYQISFWQRKWAG